MCDCKVEINLTPMEDVKPKTYSWRFVDDLNDWSMDGRADSPEAALREALRLKERLNK